MAEIEAMIFEPTGPKVTRPDDPKTSKKKTKKSTEVPFSDDTGPVAEGEDDDAQEAGETERADKNRVPDLKILKDLFNAYVKDKEQFRPLMYAKLVEIYDSYMRDPPGGAIKYVPAKVLFTEMMFKLRKIAKQNSDVEDWSFVLRAPPNGREGTLMIVPTSNFSRSITMEQRLRDEPTIVVFSLVDLACLAAALKDQRRILQSVSGRKTAEKSVPDVKAVIEKLEFIANKTKDTLRRLSGSMIELEQQQYLLAGEPLSIAVGRKKSLVDSAKDPEADYGVVAIYFDFAKVELDVVKAYDYDNYSAAQLDAAYEPMRTHPDRIILLDTREEYKRKRNWSQ